ncbi:intraflagellar transport protein 22 homolog isoform X2 [Sinocyclocheilus rhinocerous]|uniref:intraflagellar transport protein 22 homolog isoform X2 n=1 Tax=Sinocyclocheilus rhinocerous TaxID=307959 RepID=UPI0007B98934|nr:PREDICTED: intraflagellar transport protein 22 homolog isoform X2 [Sinocyclocheilus rhinocerous]
MKILLIGPSECGKTVLASFLSDTTETIGADYSPTQGARILEFESQSLSNGNKKSACEVELWDCAGDFKFESCWPALVKDANGGLQDAQCLLIAHHNPGSGAGTTRPPLAPQLNKLPLIHSILEEEPEDVRQEFHKYLGNVMRMLSENQEREEMSIIT